MLLGQVLGVLFFFFFFLGGRQKTGTSAAEEELEHTQLGLQGLSFDSRAAKAFDGKWKNFFQESSHLPFFCFVPLSLFPNCSGRDIVSLSDCHFGVVRFQLFI